jgi:nucleoside-diphosphate-sugar epimerase
MPDAENPIVVAVTGPTGTFGFGLIPLLESEPSIERIIGIARRPFDPQAEGWTKMDYRRGDVRDPDALRHAFSGADVVVHLAFMITGNASPQTITDINIGGTLNAFRAARDAGAKRFVYASSVAAYGFHRDNPVGMSEAWPVRPAARLFYAREKAQLERALEQEAQASSEPALYLLRPPIVLGPHAYGAKDVVPELVARASGAAFGFLRRLRVPLPVLAPNVPVQLIHEEDVGQALLGCVLGQGPPGAYNIAADEVLTGAEVMRELGLAPVPLPSRVVYATARVAAALPKRGLPPAVDWVEALSHPAIMDTTKAKEQLGWRPKYSAREALRDTRGE